MRSDNATCFVGARNEIEKNLRPLVKSEDPCSLPPLTPIALMTGYYAQSPVPVRPSEERDVLRRGFKFTQRIADLWWKRWLREYIPLLQARQKWLKEEPNFKVGDLILLADEASPRNQYPLAEITETKLDSDEKGRTGVARKADGTLRPRDIRKIALVERAPK